VNIRVNGQLTYNSLYDCLDAAMAGLGVAYVPEDIAQPYIRTGHLVSVLEDWCPYWSGYHLYYPSRRQPSGAMPPADCGPALRAVGQDQARAQVTQPLPLPD